MNQKQEQALDAIRTLILWYSSNETERDRLYEAALDYVEQDHTLTEENT